MILKGFLKKELIQLFRNPVMIFAVIVMPVVQVIILSKAITNEPKNIRLVIDVEPNDYMLRQIYDRALSSGWFVKVPNLKESAIKIVQNGKADVAVIAPKGGLTRAIARGEGEVQILIDSTNVLRAQAVDGYIKAIAADVLKEHVTVKPPISFSLRILFNPQLDTQLFIIPSTMAMILFMSVLSLVSTSITREKEIGTIETLISAPIKKHHIILGKILPFIAIGFINMILIQMAGALMFDLPFRGSVFQYAASFFAFIVPAAAAGLLLATYSDTQQQGMLGMMIVAFLSMMLSGGMFPIENMPLFLQAIAHLNPLTHYTFLVRNAVLKGDDWGYFFTHVGALLSIGSVLMFFAVRRFKTTL